MEDLINTSRKRVKKTTSDQFDLLLREMSQRPNAARGYAFGLKRDKVDAEWREIVVQLNKLGPPIRNISGWKKVWTDYRNRLNNKKATCSKMKRLCHSDDMVMECINDTAIVPAITENLLEDHIASSSIEWHQNYSLNSPKAQETMELSNLDGVDYDKINIIPEVTNDYKDQGQANNEETQQQSPILGQLSAITTLLERQVVAIEQQTIQMEQQKLILESLMALLKEKFN